MSKIQFLRDQYFDMLASGQHVCDRWQTSFQNFVDDLEHATPANPGRRYLSLKAKDLGFTPQAFVTGYQDAFWALIALALLGAVAAFILLRGVKREHVAEQEPAGVAV